MKEKRIAQALTYCLYRELKSMGKASTEQDPAYLLDSIIQLREDVYREGQETIQRWEPRIKRNSFLNSALNLSYYLSLRRSD
ncbi:MAG TPA: hypothetical protein VIG98_08400 [Bacillus sp. (in: firmicutes)]|jgi:hypothetical protein